MEVLPEFAADVAGVAEVPPGVFGGAFPDAGLGGGEEFGEAGVGVGDLGVKAGELDDAAEVEVVAVVVEAVAVAGFDFVDEGVPAFNHAGGSGFDDVGGVAVIVEVGLDFFVGHARCLAFGGEAMLLAVVGSVVQLRALEEFVAAVAGLVLDAGAEGVHFSGGHGFEVAGEGDVGFELLHRRDAHDLRRDGEAEAVAVALVGGEAECFKQATLGVAPAETLHADDADTLLEADGDDGFLEAAVEGVADVDGHLGGVPGVGLVEHLEMDLRILVAGEADEANLAGFLGFESRFEAALFEDPVGIVVVDHFVELPEIEVVGLEATEGLVEIAQRTGVVAFAVLGHEEDLIAAVIHFQSFAHDLFGVAVVIVPGVVEEGEAFVDGGVHDADGFRVFLDAADVPAAEAGHRDLYAGAAEGTLGEAGAGGLRHGLVGEDGEGGGLEEMSTGLRGGRHGPTLPQLEGYGVGVVVDRRFTATVKDGEAAGFDDEFVVAGVGGGGEDALGVDSLEGGLAGFEI